MSISVKKLQISRFWSKFSKNFDFGQNLWKSRVRSKLSKISSLVNIYKNLDFGQSLWKFRFWSKLSENLDHGQHFGKISILVNIIYRFGTKFSPNLGFGPNFRKMSIWVKICKYVDFGPKISIWVKIFENIDFGENCRKISILVEI